MFLHLTLYILFFLLLSVSCNFGWNWTQLCRVLEIEVNSINLCKWVYCFFLLDLVSLLRSCRFAFSSWYNFHSVPKFSNFSCITSCLWWGLSWWRIFLNVFVLLSAFDILCQNCASDSWCSCLSSSSRLLFFTWFLLSGCDGVLSQVLFRPQS